MLPANLKSYLIPTLIATSSALIGVASCPANPSAPQLRFQAPRWATDAKTQQIVRGSQRIKTSDPRFNQFLCTTRAAVQAHEEQLVRLSYHCTCDAQAYAGAE